MPSVLGGEVRDAPAQPKTTEQSRPRRRRIHAGHAQQKHLVESAAIAQRDQQLAAATADLKGAAAIRTVDVASQDRPVVSDQRDGAEASQNAQEGSKGPDALADIAELRTMLEAQQAEIAGLRAQLDQVQRLTLVGAQDRTTVADAAKAEEVLRELQAQPAVETSSVVPVGVSTIEEWRDRLTAKNAALVPAGQQTVDVVSKPPTSAVGKVGEDQVVVQHGPVEDVRTKEPLPIEQDYIDVTNPSEKTYAQKVDALRRKFNLAEKDARGKPDDSPEVQVASALGKEIVAFCDAELAKEGVVKPESTGSLDADLKANAQFESKRTALLAQMVEGEEYQSAFKEGLATLRDASAERARTAQRNVDVARRAGSLTPEDDRLLRNEIIRIEAELPAADPIRQGEIQNTLRALHEVVGIYEDVRMPAIQNTQSAGEVNGIVWKTLYPGGPSVAGPDSGVAIPDGATTTTVAEGLPDRRDVMRRVAKLKDASTDLMGIDLAAVRGDVEALLPDERSQESVDADGNTVTSVFNPKLEARDILGRIQNARRSGDSAKIPGLVTELQDLIVPLSFGRLDQYEGPGTFNNAIMTEAEKHALRSEQAVVPGSENRSRFRRLADRFRLGGKSNVGKALRVGGAASAIIGGGDALNLTAAVPHIADSAYHQAAGFVGSLADSLRADGIELVEAAETQATVKPEENTSSIRYRETQADEVSAAKLKEPKEKVDVDASGENTESEPMSQKITAREGEGITQVTQRETGSYPVWQHDASENPVRPNPDWVVYMLDHNSEAMGVSDAEKPEVMEKAKDLAKKANAGDADAQTKLEEMAGSLQSGVPIEVPTEAGWQDYLQEVYPDQQGES